MKAMRIVMAIAALTSLGAAAPISPQKASQNAPGAPAPSASGYSCQEDCAYDCADRYPDDSNMALLCTYSCISSACGGADFP